MFYFKKRIENNSIWKRDDKGEATIILFIISCITLILINFRET